MSCLTRKVNKMRLWLKHSYVADRRLKGLWLYFQGKLINRKNWRRKKKKKNGIVRKASPVKCHLYIEKLCEFKNWKGKNRTNSAQKNPIRKQKLQHEYHLGRQCTLIKIDGCSHTFTWLLSGPSVRVLWLPSKNHYARFTGHRCQPKIILKITLSR